ncbi:BlaI/MecI/CopY family transcriptional regulator [Abyssisolibacter fermentans]|uniref:BlaI/MecI/CopY family transcriptional regulator n=1 Tax=Abyssisolibacter fermentans TaxID=1766203 RepID=UPI000830C72D|nr:BlaI/MecI/CopY family transcriptional regulator [Abyssisolibacter fermentans]
MNQLPKITDSEWIIMQIVWNDPPHTSSEIMDNLPVNINWRPTTVKTLLSRLVKKNIVSYEKKNRTYYYYPLLSKEECIRAESKSFLQNKFGGALKLMIANFLEIEDLSDKEIDELKNILDNRKNKERE